MSTRFAGKIAVVSGGATGIGKAVAARLRTEGATVVTTYRNRPAKDDPDAVHCDVAKEEDVANLFELCAKRYGRVDLLCNNAGISGATTLRVHEYGVELWDEVLAVNLRGPFLMLRHALPLMLGAGGAIVNITSLGAFSARPGFCAYTASKAALTLLTRQAALEYAADGIRVNAVAPGLIETTLLDDLTPEMRDQRAASIPLGRIGAAAEVATVVAFLLSDEASYTTGHTYVIDGGRTA